jgi:NAD(P)-dependent dehydrogenase (short-subunit alcohol dehydrogenase family)
MNAPRQPRTILVTGATGAIGGALALEYAAPGVLLLLQGRDPEALATLAVACRALGAEVQVAALDVTDRAAYLAWLQEAAQTRLPDLVILAAGINQHPASPLQPESLNAVAHLFAVNVAAIFLAMDCLVPAMQRRGHGQIALLSSLAAWFGLPMAPAYSASKAALRAYGEALRPLLEPTGVKINVVMPGYVSSRMCDEMPGPKPWRWTAPRAARRIRIGLDSDQSRIAFPFLLDLGCRALAVMPARFANALLRLLGFGA